MWKKLVGFELGATVGNTVSNKSVKIFKYDKNGSRIFLQEGEEAWWAVCEQIHLIFGLFTILSFWHKSVLRIELQISSVSGPDPW